MTDKQWAEMRRCRLRILRGSRARIRAGWIMFLLLMLAQLAHAQSDIPSVAQVQRAYDALRFEEAVKLAQAALAHPERYSPADLVQLHLLSGYLGFVNDQMVEARRNFESALSLQPDLTLDSLLVSPKIVRFFEQVKNEFHVGLSAGTPSVKYIMVADQRLGALRRSLLMPGWGQRHLNHDRRGWLYTAAFVAAAGASVALHVLQDRAHDRYLTATTPDRIAQRYEDFNQLYRWRNGMLITSAGLWAANVLDVLVSAPLELGPPANATWPQPLRLGFSFPLRKP